jgi:hypothetical protein
MSGFPFPINFSEKNELTDFCLVVEDREFHVPKGYLGTISSFFRRICFENPKVIRYVIEDVCADDVLEFLNVVLDNPVCNTINGKNP